LDVFKSVLTAFLRKAEILSQILTLNSDEAVPKTQGLAGYHVSVPSC